MPTRPAMTRLAAAIWPLVLVGFGVLGAIGLIGGTHGAQAKAPTDIRGRWAWVSVVGTKKYPQTITIRTQDLATGKFSGVDKGRVIMNVTGKVTGDRFTLHLKQRGAPYTADATGTLDLEDGKRTMAGRFTDNIGNHGSFTATAGAPPDPEETPEPSPTPSPTPGNGLGYEDPPHNIHMDERPSACTDPSLITWGPDSIGRMRYLFGGRYRPCLLQLNPNAGSVAVSYEATVTKWGYEWDRYRVDTTGGTVTRPDGRAVPITTWDFGTQSACFLSDCSALYPWYNPFQVYWSAADSRIEWVPVVTGTAVLPTNPDTGPQYARTTCVVGKPCEILVQRPPALELGVPYWVRLSVFGYCQEQYLGYSGCSGDGMTVAARELLADARPGGSAIGPTAAFIATQHDPDAPWVFDSAGSTASPPSTIVSWEWDFGDRSKSTIRNPSHEYAEPRRYHVTLKVTDSLGRTATAGQDIGEADTALVVNSTGDASRGPKAGDACDTGEEIRGRPECTLRAAIETANARDAASTITFAIAGDGIPVIQHTTKYESLAKPVVIDGTSQAGGWVQLTGPTNTAVTGLTIGGGQSRITGVIITGFAVALQVYGEGNLIEGNRIGTDAAGNRSAYGTAGIVLVGATDTTIRDNVIAGNSFGVRGRDGAIARVSGNHIGVGPTGDAFGTEVGVYVAPATGGGAWTISDNTIQATHLGILTQGTAAAGSTISGNTVFLPHSRSNSGTTGILVDGAPRVGISDNPSIISTGGWDIGVTGASQAVQRADRISFLDPDRAQAGEVTGGRVTISGNTLGLDPTGNVPGTSRNDRSDHGIAVYGAASDVRIEGNVSAGHALTDIEVFGGAGHQVTGNNIGVDKSGSKGMGSGNGLGLYGVRDTLVQGNTISGVQYTGLQIAGDLNDPSHNPSQNVTVTGNRIGVGTDTAKAVSTATWGIAIRGSVNAVIGPDNVISGNGTGISVDETAKGTDIAHNVIGADRARRVAVPNKLGIASNAPDITIGENTVVGNTEAGIQIQDGSATIGRNQIGVGAGGKALGNGVGVAVSRGASALLGDNTIANSAKDGLRIDAGGHAQVISVSTYANTGKGIGGEGAAAPPKLDVVDVGTGANARRWFVVSGTAGRSVRIYGNTDCGDPDEGRTLVDTRENGLGAKAGGSQVVTATVKRSYAGYTALLLDGKDTSSFSDCAKPKRYPDTSGTGIPDIVQLALGGDPTAPATVSFPADIGFVKLETTHGHFAAVTPGGTPPSGADLPLGAFSFQVTGLTPGALDTVLLTSSKAILRSYWRYGRETPSAPMRWYAWMYDAINHTGPRVTGSQVILHLVDGGDGDDDVLANGVIQQ